MKRNGKKKRNVKRKRKIRRKKRPNLIKHRIKSR